MNDYIRKDKAIDIFIEGDGGDEFTEGYNFAVNEYREKIKAMPAADVQPVKHGYWKEEEPRVLKCSVCGEYAPMNYLGQNCIDSTYCPWCGARMIKDGDTNG